VRLRSIAGSLLSKEGAVSRVTAIADDDDVAAGSMPASIASKCPHRVAMDLHWDVHFL